MRRGLGFHNRRSPGVFSPLSLFAGGVNGAWYDPSDATTLFTTSAGTTPCAEPGAGALVNVGLMLDKSQNLTLGSELAGSILSGTSGWTFVGAATVSGGAIVFTTPPSTNASAQYNPIVSSGLWYRVQITLTGTGQVTVQLGSAGTSATFTAPGSYSFTGLASGGTPTVLTFSSVLSSVNNFVGSVTAVSVRTLSGNHAIAANDTTARPELSARVNLLTYSEDFSNAVWGTGATVGSVTKGTTTGTRPDGTTGTVNTLTFPVVNAGQIAIAFQSSGQTLLNVQITGSIYVRVSSGTATIYLNLEDNNNTPSGTNFVAGSAETVTTSWKRISLTGARATAPGPVSLVFGFDTRCAAGQTNAAPVTIEVWGADLRPTNIGTTIPAYQRVADQYTYDTVGFPRYLRFDGVDDAMSTPANVNLSGTDKATVFAGVRKLADGALRAVSEFSAEVASNNGSFAAWAPFGSSPTYGASLKGTATAFGASTTGFAAPISNVATWRFNLAGVDSTALLPIRINGVDQTMSATTGTAGGNFGTYPLFIGARNLASNFLTGNIYSLIVVGAASSAGQISSTEQWIAGKTGLSLP